MGFKKVKDAKWGIGKTERHKGQVITEESEIYKLKQGKKVYYVRIDEFGNDTNFDAGSKTPHYHVDSCDPTKPATNPVKDEDGKNQKNLDGTWKTTEDPTMTQDQHYEKSWEPSAVNYDRNGDPVHPGDKDWADKTHLTAG